MEGQYIDRTIRQARPTLTLDSHLLDTAWQEMMHQSKPPILDTPISPFLTEDSLSKRAINLNGDKFRQVTGWRPTVKSVRARDLKLQAEAFQRAQLWSVLGLGNI